MSIDWALCGLTFVFYVVGFVSGCLFMWTIARDAIREAARDTRREL